METIQITQQETKLKVGDVLVYSWGYDQTNIDFFKVVGLTKTMVKIRQLKSVVTETGFMCGDSIPTNEFKSDEVIRKKPVDLDGVYTGITAAIPITRLKEILK